MEILLWVIVSVVLLMSLTAIKAVWRLKAQVKSLELDLDIAKGSIKDARDFAEEGTRTLKSQMARLASGQSLTPEMVLSGKQYLDLPSYEGLKLYQDAKDLFLLDVRTKEEFDSGHIPNAKNIPVDALDARLRELPIVKSRKILVYCHSGGRSAAASEHLSHVGFTNVHNLLGGMSQWTGARKEEGITQSS